MIACVSHASETFSGMFPLSSSSIGFVLKWSLYSSSYHQDEKGKAPYAFSYISSDVVKDRQT